MGATPIYGLPWPEGTDPPDGSAQLHSSMTAIEAALLTARRTMTLPTAWSPAVQRDLLPASGQSTVQWSAWQCIGPPFINWSANAFRITKTGWYDLYVRVRMRYTTGTAVGYGTLVATGPWSTLIPSQMQPYAITNADVELRWTGLIGASIINQPINVVTESTATGTYSHQGAVSQISMIRLGDG